MKIVHVISGLTKGGGERMAVELANQTAINGNEVVLLVGWPEDPGLLQYLINPRVTLQFVSMKKSGWIIRMFIWLMNNKRLLQQQDVIHCHLTYGSVFGYFARKFIFQTPPVILETNHAVGMAIPKLNRWLQKQIAKKQDGIAFMAMDPYWKNFIANYPYKKTILIKNGINISKPEIDRSERQHIYKQYGIPDDCEYLIGTVGMLRPDRQPWLYLPLFKRIYQQLGNKTHFVMGGSGPEFSRTKEKIEELELGKNFHLVGLINEPLPIISIMDIYVSLCAGSTAGISMIEAAMCEVAVVGIQLIDDHQMGEDDWIWSNVDLCKVADKMIFLLKEEEERNRLQTLQKEYVHNHFTAEVMYKKYEIFYQQLLARI